MNPKIPSTIEAAALCKMAERGQIRGGILDGPLALDNAINEEARATSPLPPGGRGRGPRLRGRVRGPERRLNLAVAPAHVPSPQPSPAGGRGRAARFRGGGEDAAQPRAEADEKVGSARRRYPPQAASASRIWGGGSATASTGRSSGIDSARASRCSFGPPRP